MEHARDRGRARLAGLDGVVAHALHDLERVSLLAPVLVDRHRFTKYRRRVLALSRGECQTGSRRYHPDRDAGRFSRDLQGRRHDGQDRVAVQAARLRVPEQRDLRRPGVELRLRPLRRPAQEQRQGPVVAGDAPGARRRRRARLGDHPAPADVGGERPPGRIHRPAGRLPDVQAALPRRPSRPVGVRAQALQAPGRDARLRPDRGPGLQPDVRDHGRAGPRGGLDRLPAPGDRPGDLPELQELPPVLAQEAAVRDRPDRQELPQRDHHRELHLPHPRVRADGDGVLRAARRRPRSGTSTGWPSA